MNDKVTDEGVQRALKAAFLLIDDGELQEKLQDEKHFNEVLTQFGLPSSARIALLELMNRVERIRMPASDIDVKVDQSISSSDKNKIEKMLMESFVQIRWSFWISLIMSVILFIVGLIFLGIAVMRSLSESAVSTSTLTIAGLGVAAFCAPFDIESFRRNAHSLKSNANTFGATELANQAKELETMSREKNLDIGDRLEKLKYAFSAAATELKEMRV